MQENKIKPDTSVIEITIETSDLFLVFRKAVKAIIVVLVIKLLLVSMAIMGFYYVATSLANLSMLALINIAGISLSLSSIAMILLSSKPLLTLYIKKLRLFPHLQAVLSSTVILLALSISILAIAINTIAINLYNLESTHLRILGIPVANVSATVSNLATVRSIVENLLSIPSLSTSILGVLLALSGMFISDLLYLYAIGLAAVIGAMMGMYRAVIVTCIYAGTLIGLWCIPVTLLPISIAIVCTWIVASASLAITFDELSINVLKVCSDGKGFA
ncbi:MAG TPA: hypothetical protein EYP48_02650 [Ignisphaera sp.]|uniref:Uncharacterized protein n=1 Tax=Ignisphaera aggregans TaxID=334771 RepID=A0A832YY66_9CREN|nr:hypothetical protein [Ignisphaera sp.]HIP57348.1 hypothetical protein [Ignisphaera aggregans]